MKKINLLFLSLFCLTFIKCKQNSISPLEKRWSEQRAWDWQKENGWMVGTNFNPSNSINQLEFWQEDTYDPVIIEKELEWSAELGMNLHRVYLHNLLWDQDSLGFLKRIENYLKIVDLSHASLLLTIQRI